MTTEVRRISVITPMLNEVDHVEHYLEDIAAQDFPGLVEVLVADGGSCDASVERLRRAAEDAGISLAVLENPEGWVSQGLNACVRAASGDLLVRLDCHSRYPPDYLTRCARAAEETGALVVGGVIEARGRSFVERAVATAMDSPFGGIGFYRVTTGEGGPVRRVAAMLGLSMARRGAAGVRVETDTVTFGAFRPEAFRAAGLFDESLQRNQDDELNLRIRRAGGRIVLDPAIRVLYTPRGSLGGVFRQYYEYGVWKVPVLRKHRRAPTLRSLAPPSFVLSLFALAGASVVSRTARQLLAAELGVYGSAAAGAASVAVRGRRESWRIAPAVIGVFVAFHLGYGAGMLRGLIRAAAER